MSEVATKRNSPETPAANGGAARDAAAKNGRTVSTRAPSSIEVYKQDFALQSAAPDWLLSLRQQGITRFEALGFPTTKNEDWHFTSVAPIAERTFTLATLETSKRAGIEPGGQSSRGVPPER